MVLQAYEYEKRDNCLKTHQEFFDSTDGKFNHPLVVNLVNEIKAQRDAAVENQNNEDDVDDNTKSAKQAATSSSS
jgi:putative hydrolase of HD superfamily